MPDFNVHTLFKFCPACGGTNFRVRQPNLLVCGVCDFRYHINLAVAVGAIITDRAGEVLLIRRATEPGLGKLAVPGGFVELDETAESAVVREVMEEVGIEIRAPKFLVSATNQYFYRGINYPVLDLFYTAEVDNFDDARGNAEVQHLAFMPARSVPLDQIAFPSIVAAFKHYLSLPLPST